MALDFEARWDKAQAFKRLAEMAMKYYAEDKKPLWGVFREWWSGEGRLVYSTQGGSVGAPWKPLSRKWIERKSAKGLLTGPNEMTGRTRAAVEGASGQSVIQGKKGMKIGLRPYPGFFDRKHGTRSPWYILDSARKLAGGELRQMLRLDNMVQREVSRFDSTMGAGNAE